MTPPSECPTMCTLSAPVASHSRSTWSLQLVRRFPQVAGEQAVVDGVHHPEPAPAQRAAEHGEDGAVVHDPVDEQDRGARRLRVGDDEAAPQRAERVGAVAVRGLQLLAHRATGVDGDVRGEPRPFLDQAPEPGAGAERAQCVPTGTHQLDRPVHV